MDSSCTLEIHSIEAGYLLRIVGRGTMKESPTARDFATGAIEEGRNFDRRSQLLHLSRQYLSRLLGPT